MALTWREAHVRMSPGTGETDVHLGAEFAELQGAGDAAGCLESCPPLRQFSFPDRVGDGRLRRRHGYGHVP
jgi:hypothetical protein